MSGKVIPSEPTPLPAEWRALERVTLLDTLLYMKKQMEAGRGLWFFTGRDTFDSLLSYIFGWEASCSYNGVREENWEEFYVWLQRRGFVPAEGWHAKLYRDAQGDDAAAIRAFLSLVAEFMGQQGAGPRG